MRNIIESVESGGILDDMGVEAGDALLEINGKRIKDVFDYRFLAAEEYVEVLVLKKDGEEWLLEIEKDEYEDLGASFLEPLMDKPKSCRNKCVFCFIDQLPRGMRKPLYFKDDDARLSFLTGNYVTLTNLSRKELDRLIYYRLSPVNVSVHTTDAALRVKMMGNKDAALIMEQLLKLSEAGISINCQLVLVKGLNDGEQLRKSIRELSDIEGVKSVSAVPVGLTSHRNNLTALEPLSREDALEVIGIIHEEQTRAYKSKGLNFIYAGDELYLTAGLPIPAYEEYDGFPQLENGVGMIALFEREFDERLNELPADDIKRSVTVITGRLAEPFIKKLAKKACDKFTKTEIRVIMVLNRFLGEEITVAGLLTGRDIISSLKENNVKGRVLLPSSCFKADSDIFLDGVSLSDLTALEGIIAVRVLSSGDAFINALLEETK